MLSGTITIKSIVTINLAQRREPPIIKDNCNNLFNYCSYPEVRLFLQQ